MKANHLYLYKNWNLPKGSALRKQILVAFIVPIAFLRVGTQSTNLILEPSLFYLLIYFFRTISIFLRQGLTVFSRLVLNLWAQVMLPPQFPEQLSPRACATKNNFYSKIREMNWLYTFIFVTRSLGTWLPFFSYKYHMLNVLLEHLHLFALVFSLSSWPGREGSKRGSKYGTIIR